MMKINKVKSIVRRMARNYSNYDEIINGLKEKKKTGAKKDVNSFIKSKNSISCNTEIQAIKNLNIDKKISELKEWKNIIDYVFEESESEDKYKGQALKYKFQDNMCNEVIIEILSLPPNTLRNWSNEFILEVAILAIDRNIIKIDRL